MNTEQLFVSEDNLGFEWCYENEVIDNPNSNVGPFCDTEEGDMRDLNFLENISSDIRIEEEDLNSSPKRFTINDGSMIRQTSKNISFTILRQREDRLLANINRSIEEVNKRIEEKKSQLNNMVHQKGSADRPKERETEGQLRNLDTLDVARLQQSREVNSFESIKVHFNEVQESIDESIRKQKKASTRINDDKKNKWNRRVLCVPSSLICQAGLSTPSEDQLAFARLFVVNQQKPVFHGNSEQLDSFLIHHYHVINSFKFLSDSEKIDVLLRSLGEKPRREIESYARIFGHTLAVERLREIYSPSKQFNNYI